MQRQSNGFRFLKSVLLLPLLVFPFGVRADDAAKSPHRSPFGLALTPSIQFPSSDASVYGVRFGWLGENRNLRGGAVSLYANGDESCMGFEASLFGNFSGNVSGLQLAGIFNIAVHDMTGLQVATLFNGCGRNMTGMQVSLFGNVAGESFGAFYEGPKSMCGFQIAGVCNFCENLEGIQVGLLNDCSGACNGAQIGVWNKAETLNGFQFGLVNFASSGSGIQIGLANQFGEAIYPIVNFSF